MAFPRRLKMPLILVGLMTLSLLLISLFLGRIVATAIETLGPKITQTRVEVGLVTLSVLGRVGIHSFSLGNPEGFPKRNAVEFKTFRVALTPRSLFTNKIIIHQVLIDSPTIFYESSNRGNNLQVIQRNAERHAGGSEKSSAPEKKLVIKDLQIRNATIYWSGGLSTEPLRFSLPDIHLKDIGTEAKGVTPDEAASRILGALTASIGPILQAAVEQAAKGALEKNFRKLLGR